MASALEFIEHVTANAGKVQRRVLAEILSQNAPAEYLRRYGVPGGSADAVEAFRRVVPLVNYEGLQPHDPYTEYTSPNEAILCVDSY